MVTLSWIEAVASQSIGGRRSKTREISKSHVCVTYIPDNVSPSRVPKKQVLKGLRIINHGLHTLDWNSLPRDFMNELVRLNFQPHMCFRQVKFWLKACKEEVETKTVPCATTTAQRVGVVGSDQSRQPTSNDPTSRPWERKTKLRLAKTLTLERKKKIPSTKGC